MDERTVRAYRHCRRLQRRHDPTFSAATSLLPARTRPGVHALYGFLRGADEIVDAPDRGTDATKRRAALRAWGLAVEDGLKDGSSDHPVLAALVDAGPRHRLPLELLPRYLDSMAVDCDGRVRLSSRDELDWYMEGSAATVGRLMTPLLEMPDEHREAVAQLGCAFQLTNFLRDAHEDLAMDRVYLPGLDAEQLADGRWTGDARRAVRHQVGRAHRMFAAEREVLAHAPRRMRPGIRLACSVYRRTLRGIERRDFVLA